MVVKVLRNLGASKDCCDSRCCKDTIHNDTVAEGRRIGQDNGDDVQKTDVTDLEWSERTRPGTAVVARITYPVNSVCSCVRFDVVACCFHDRSHDDEQQHAEEAFDTAPDVENLGDEQVTNTTCDRSNDADDGGQSMFAERRSDVWVEVGLNRRE